MSGRIRVLRKASLFKERKLSQRGIYSQTKNSKPGACIVHYEQKNIEFIMLFVNLYLKLFFFYSQAQQ